MNTNDLFSPDRLIEFGMSAAIARQMVMSMNDILANMRIPGSMTNMNPLPAAGWFYAMIDGSRAGPFSETEIARLIGEKKITKETYLWMPGMAGWQPAENIPAVVRLVALTPPEFQHVQKAGRRDEN
jgi:hypothetical protein